MWLFVLFIAVPLIEIALFIQIGGIIGLLPTLVIVVLTAILGSWLVRSQGARELQNLRSSFSELSDPSEPLAHGAMILFSGALLLTPGFFTDAVGFSLLIPAVRTAVYQRVKSRVKTASFQMGPGHEQSFHQGPSDHVIDGEYENLNQSGNTSDKPSGWTQH